MDKEIDYKKLRDGRKDKDLSQKALADKLFISRSAYSKLENGKKGVRVEQLGIIAKVLGKNIDYFLKEKNTTQNMTGNIKNETDLLESLLALIAVGAEEELFSLYHQYSDKYPYQQFSYEDFLDCESPMGNPEGAVEEIKKLTKEYEEILPNPGEWYRNRVNSLYEQFDREGKRDSQGNYSGVNYSEDFVGFHPFCHVFGRVEFDLFKDKDDAWILRYVTDENNYYDFTYHIINGGYYQTNENSLLAFIEMLDENPIILKLFKYGLLENSWFGGYWKSYLDIKNIEPEVELENHTTAIQTVSIKMKEIFERRLSS